MTPIPVETAAAALLMVVVANSAPWLAGRLLRDRFASPLDCRLCWPDGIRLLGEHKTWRGLIAALLACGLAGRLLGFGILLGIAFGALAMLGDALSSGIKRRLQRPPGTEVPGLDQIPEALLPLLVLGNAMQLDAMAVATVVVVFAVLDAATTALRHQ